VVGNGNWYALNFPPFVSKIAFDGSGNLYAGGYFVNAGGSNAYCIARFDGYSWGPLGSGLGAKNHLMMDVSALAVDKSNTLYVIGYFDTAGGNPAPGFAKCALSGTSAGSQHYRISRQPALPLIKVGKVQFTLPRPSSVIYRVLDISGKLLAYRETLVLDAGNHTIKIATGDLCPGVYILDFLAGDQSFKGKFSITK
jgi:hypothetical protein